MYSTGVTALGQEVPAKLRSDVLVESFLEQDYLRDSPLWEVLSAERVVIVAHAVLDV